MRAMLNFRGPLLQTMVAAGHEVHGCTPAAPAEQMRRLEALGVQYHAVPLERGGLNPLRDARLIRQLERIMQRAAPDVIFAAGLKPAFYGAIAARRRRVPRVYVMVEGLGFAFSGTGLKAQAVRRIAKTMWRVSARRSDGVFFLNPDDVELFRRERLLDDPDRTILLDGIGIDLDRVRQASLPDQPAFLQLSRLLISKGLRDYAAAARLVRAEHPEVPFRLAGRVDDANPSAVPVDELDGWVREGLIEYLGALDDVRPAIEASSVIVLPSYREGLPVSLMEGMAMGRPAVTTDVPGCRQTIEPGISGFLVPPRDPDALAAALRRFVGEPALAARMGWAARRRAEAKFDVHTINRTIMTRLGLL
jgi:glycosyltransferase involved in cell wall biosynthesis